MRPGLVLVATDGHRMHLAPYDGSEGPDPTWAQRTSVAARVIATSTTMVVLPPRRELRDQVTVDAQYARSEYLDALELDPIVVVREDGGVAIVMPMRR